MIIGKINSIQTIDKRVSDARGKKLEVQGTMMDAPEFFFSFFFFTRNLSDFAFSIEIVFCFPLFHNHPPIHETLFHH